MRDKFTDNLNQPRNKKYTKKAYKIKTCHIKMVHWRERLECPNKVKI